MKGMPPGWRGNWRHDRYATITLPPLSCAFALLSPLLRLKNIMTIRCWPLVSLYRGLLKLETLCFCLQKNTPGAILRYSQTFFSEKKS